MKKIESFNSFSQLQTQLREEAAQKELAVKREASVKEYNELLAKYNVAKVTELSEEDRATFMQELGEGNAFTGALKKAKEDGEDEFEVGGETYKVEEDETEEVEDAEEVDESEVNENKYAKAGKLGYNDQFLNKRRSLSKTLAVDLGLNPKHEFGGGDWLGFDHISLYATGGEKRGTILADALSGKYTYDDLKSAAAEFLGMNESAEEDGIEEGRAFVAAAKKAKEEGKEEFEYNGKTFPVLIKEGVEITELLEANKREVTAVSRSYQVYAGKFPVLNLMSDVTFLWTIREILKAALIDANFHTEAAMIGKYITPAKYENIEINPSELGGQIFIKVPKKVVVEMVDLIASNVTAAGKYNGYAIIEGTAKFLEGIRIGKKPAEGIRAALAALQA